MCIRDRKSRADLETIISDIKQLQKLDTKLEKLRNRLKESDEKITPYYCTHNDIVFIRQKPHQDNWEIVIPATKEKTLIIDYHVRYGHMGALR